MRKIPFTVSARTAKLLGRENVSNADGAIIELVKNCYDAEATLGLVYFENHDVNKDNHAIYIIDNGSGMTEEIIESYWMTIGTNNKEINFLGNDGRVKSGAKGIGRLALDRLGNRAEMITKTEKSDFANKWNVAWSDFEDEEGSISNVFAELDHLPNFDFSQFVHQILEKHPKFKEIISSHHFSKGTVIKITELRDEWDNYFVNNTYSNLSMIVPPSEHEIFTLSLLSSLTPTSYGKVESIVNDEYDYKLVAELDSNQTMKITIHRNEFDLNIIDMDLFSLPEMKVFPYDIESLEKGIFTSLKSLNSLLPGYNEKVNQNIYNQIGPFQFTLYFLKRSFSKIDRKKYFYRNFNISERGQWLDKFSGIKLYRDHFRVRPYGEMNGSSYDWLMLGERAAKSPAAPSHPSGSWRVRPNQISGSISISRLTNINFEDKSSREGLQENQSFTIFKELIINLINQFETDRQFIMRAMDRLVRIKDMEETNKREANVIAKKIISFTENGKQDAKDTTSNKQLTELMKPENVQKLAKSYLASVQENKDLASELQLLRGMASTGLTITTFAHELKNISANIIPRNKNLLKILERLIDKIELESLPDFKNPYIIVDDMRKQDERLKNWLDISLSAVRKDKRNRKKIDLYVAFQELYRVWNPQLSFQSVTFNIPTSTNTSCIFRMFEIDLDSIFNNLISNSLAAFKRSDASNDRNIKMTLSSDEKNLIIKYEDSGPGLSKDITDPNKIFEPLFTTTRDEKGNKVGTGLGMWIVKSTVEEYKGTVRVTKSRPNFGIEMFFPLKAGEGFIQHEK
jgi:signal transduction histidine kinase